MSQKTDLKIENISTNHLLVEAQYTVRNAIRTNAGTYQGIELFLSEIIFYYLGKNYYLKNGSVYDDGSKCILQNYKRHFEKDGQLYLENLSNALYKIAKNSPILQTHRYSLWEDKIFYNSISKNNIPFIGTDKEILYANNKGEIFIINIEESYYWTNSDDGKKVEKFLIIPSVPTHEKIFFIKAEEGIEICLYKNSNIEHYQIIDQTLTLLQKTPCLIPLAIEKVNTDLIYIFKRETDFFYKNLTTSEEQKITGSIIEPIKTKINKAINNDEYQQAIDKLEIVKYGEGTGVDTEDHTGGSFPTRNLYKEVFSKQYKPIFEITKIESTHIVKFENENILLYEQFLITIKKKEWTVALNTRRVPIRMEKGANWYFVYGDLTYTSEPTIESEVEEVVILSLFSVLNTNTKNFEAINITNKITNLKLVNTKNNYANISKNSITIEYETFPLVIEEEERDQNRNQLILTNFNYPIEKSIPEFIENNFKAEQLLEIEQETIGWDYQQGQEHTIHNPILITEALEFMNGNIIISKYNNLNIPSYPKKKILSPYQGFKSILMIVYDENNAEAWRMYSPNVEYIENLNIFCLEAGIQKKTISPVPLPKIKSWSTGGSNIFVVMESDQNAVQRRDHTKKISHNFISINDTIEEIEATTTGTFIGGKTSLRYLKATVVGNNIEFHQETVKFDHVVENIGEEFIFFFGNGFIHYIRDNKLVSEIWKIREAPLKAIKIKNNIIIKTNNLLWILTVNTGEIALISLSQEKNFTLDYSIRDEDGQNYFIKDGDPSFSFSWSQQKLRRIRAVESLSEITGGSIGNQNGGVTKIHDKYKLNLRGLLNQDKKVLVHFKKEIAKNIIIETF